MIVQIYHSPLGIALAGLKNGAMNAANPFQSSAVNQMDKSWR